MSTGLAPTYPQISPASQPSPAANVMTYDDVLYSADAFVSVSEKPSLAGRDVRMCIDEALRDLVSAGEWQSLKRVIRLHLQPVYIAGSTTPGSYDPASHNVFPLGGFCYAGLSGTSTAYGTTTVDREIIIDGLSWPGYESPPTNTLWQQPGLTVLDAELRLGAYTLNCTIDNVIDATHAQLDVRMFPSCDYTAATGFVLGFPKYPLPPEFAGAIIAAERNAWFVGNYIPWAQWLLMDKYRVFSGIVRNYTIGPDPKRYGQQAIYVHPCPSVATEYDVGMKCWMRPLNLTGRESWQNAGSVTVTPGSADIVGSGTAFDQRMVGSIFRAAVSGGQTPTALTGGYPFWFQQTVQSVTDTTHLTMSQASPALPGGGSSASGLGYCVSDPCDVPQALFEAFKEGVNLKLARLCNTKGYENQRAIYNVALRRAKAADNFDRSIKIVGQGSSTLSRLRDNANRPLFGGPTNPAGIY